MISAGVKASGWYRGRHDQPPAFEPHGDQDQASDHGHVRTAALAATGQKQHQRPQVEDGQQHDADGGPVRHPVEPRHEAAGLLRHVLIPDRQQLRVHHVRGQQAEGDHQFRLVVQLVRRRLGVGQRRDESPRRHRNVQPGDEEVDPEHQAVPVRVQSHRQVDAEKGIDDRVDEDQPGGQLLGPCRLDASPGQTRAPGRRRSPGPRCPA